MGMCTLVLENSHGKYSMSLADARDGVQATCSICYSILIYIYIYVQSCVYIYMYIYIYCSIMFDVSKLPNTPPIFLENRLGITTFGTLGGLSPPGQFQLEHTVSNDQSLTSQIPLLLL